MVIKFPTWDSEYFYPKSKGSSIGSAKPPFSDRGGGAGGSPLSLVNQPHNDAIDCNPCMTAFVSLVRFNVAVYAACFRRLAIFVMVARLQPVNDWIVLQVCCAASI